MIFKNLIDNIERTHLSLQSYASKAINVSMTVRNWLIGFYIVEFEQKGEDRAKYGDNLLDQVSQTLGKDIKGLSVTNLRLFRQFYSVYT
jgi:hypothetical protein